MGQEDERHRPQGRTYRVGRELLEVLDHKVGIALYLCHDAGIEILQAPTGYHGIETEDNHGSHHSHISHERPRLAPGKIAIGTSRIGCRMTTDDELAQHTWQTKQQDAHQIDEDERRTSILTCHIWEAPYIAQAHSRTCRGEDDAQLTSETSSILHFLQITIFRPIIPTDSRIPKESR